MQPSLSFLTTRLAPVLGGLVLLTAPSFAHVRLNAPDGGEVLCAGTTATIEWQVVIQHSTQNWDLEYSITGPTGPWLPIATDLPVGDPSAGAIHTYVWTVPDAPSNFARVRVTQDNSGTDYTDFSNGDIVILGSGSATASYRGDNAGVNPNGYTATAPVFGTTWTAAVDNGLTGNSLAGVVGYSKGLDVNFPFGSILVDITDANGELLMLPAQSGTGILVFSAPIPNDASLCGFSIATQGFGLGGPGVRLHNAYDLVIGQ